MKRTFKTDDTEGTWTMTFEPETISDRAEHDAIDPNQPVTISRNGKLVISGKLLTTPLPKPTVARPADDVRDNLQ